MDWRVASAFSEKRTGFGDDRVAVLVLDRGFVAVVADGCGSAEHGWCGAEIATDVIVECARHSQGWGASAVVSWFAAAEAAVAVAATRCSIPYWEFLTTLSVVAVAARECVIAGVGDCSVVALSAGGVLGLTRLPDRGLYASETNFLGWDSASPSIVTMDSSSIAGVCLHSDGLDRLCLSHDAPFAGFYSPLFSTARDRLSDDGLREFLESAVQPSVSDDCAMVLAMRS